MTNHTEHAAPSATLAKRLFYPALTALTVALTGAATQATACSVEAWEDCKGKPWVDGEIMDTPMGEKWWPHPIWGEGDEAGSTNWYTNPEVVLRAVSQIQSGKVYRLGHDYHSEMPMFGVRKWTMHIPGAPTGGPFGTNALIWNDEYLATEIGQVGTQFDGLGHVGVQAGEPGDKSKMYFYNGFTAEDINGTYGLKKLGVEKLHPIIARGVLIDFTSLKDWDVGDCASAADVQTALDNQGMADFEFMEGDAILLRFGWEQYWTDEAKYNSGEPGLCMDAARWVVAQNPGVTGGDTWGATDPVPYPDPTCASCVHSFFQTRHGIVNQENLRLGQLADDGAFVFTYIYSPMPIRGGTGSPGSPIAIR